MLTDRGMIRVWLANWRDFADEMREVGVWLADWQCFGDGRASLAPGSSQGMRENAPRPGSQVRSLSFDAEGESECASHSRVRRRGQGRMLLTPAAWSLVLEAGERT